MSSAILKKLSVVSVLFVVFVFQIKIISAQQLTSTNYKILDSTIDSGGGVSTTANYGLLSSLANPTADARLTSTSYALGSGFPNGVQASVPKIRCAETNTTSGTTSCLNFPNANGAQGECGFPGCYDRIKYEIDYQTNPIDTLYLVSLTDSLTSTVYYVQSTHTVATSYDIADYMTICGHEGKDTRTGSGCAINTDPQWDATLQRYNVSGLIPGRTYAVKARALQGDFTETQYGPSVNVTLQYPQLDFDIDIGTTSAASTSAPYSISFGTLTANTPTTATNSIWLDLNTNVIPGFTTYVKDLNNGLLSGSNSLPSSTEDLAVDAGNNGGFGLKTTSSTETSLGPILEGATYVTGNSTSVGAVSTSNTSAFNTTNPVAGGRVGMEVKVLSKTSTPAGNYTDTLTYTMVTNF